jgi:3-dehydroquinate synthetase
LPAVDDVLAAFRLDKKFAGGVRFVLLEDVGRPVVVEGVPEAEVRSVLEEMGAAR